MPKTELTPEEKIDRSLRRLMDHVGLGEVAISELGGNHPLRAGPPIPVRSHHPPDPFLPNSGKPKKRRKPAPLPAARAASQAASQAASKSRPKTKTASPKANDDNLPEWSVKASGALEAWRPPGEHLALLAYPGETPDPVELALRLQRLMWEKKLNITELAREIGRSRAYVRNHLRLLRMPNTIAEHVRTGRLSEGHARIIGGMRDPEAIARLVIRRQLSVRQTEIIARRLRYIGPDGQLLRDTAIPSTKHVEDLIEDALDMKVRMTDRAGRGTIEIHYRSPHECTELVHALCKAFARIPREDFDD